jgi:hypothetical protein
MAYRKDFQQLLQGISEDIPHRLLDLNMKEYTGFQVALLNKVIVSFNTTYVLLLNKSNFLLIINQFVQTSKSTCTLLQTMVIILSLNFLIKISIACE